MFSPLFLEHSVACLQEIQQQLQELQQTTEDSSELQEEVQRLQQQNQDLDRYTCLPVGVTAPCFALLQTAQSVGCDLRRSSTHCILPFISWCGVFIVEAVFKTGSVLLCTAHSTPANACCISHISSWPVLLHCLQLFFLQILVKRCSVVLQKHFCVLFRVVFVMSACHAGNVCQLNV